jgi:hypothetical protein
MTKRFDTMFMDDDMRDCLMTCYMAREGLSNETDEKAYALPLGLEISTSYFQHVVFFEIM